MTRCNGQWSPSVYTTIRCSCFNQGFFLSQLEKKQPCFNLSKARFTKYFTSRVMRNPAVCIYAKTKAQISGNRASVLSLCFHFIDSTLSLPPKASSHFLWLYSTVCIGSCREPQRQVFARRGSLLRTLRSFSDMKVRCTPAECLKMMHFEIPLKVYQRYGESHSFRQCVNIHQFFSDFKRRFLRKFTKKYMYYALN